MAGRGSVALRLDRFRKICSKLFLTLFSLTSQPTSIIIYSYPYVKMFVKMWWYIFSRKLCMQGSNCTLNPLSTLWINNLKNPGVSQHHSTFTLYKH